MRFLFFSALLAWLATAALALSAAGNRLLVVVTDEDAYKVSHSHFFGDLAQRGFDITYESPKSESLQLKHLGERTYDHMIIFPTTKLKGVQLPLLSYYTPPRWPTLFSLSVPGWVEPAVPESLPPPPLPPVQTSLLQFDDPLHSLKRPLISRRGPGLGPKLTAMALLDFVNTGGNIMVVLAANSPAPGALVTFLDQIGVALPPERTGLVVDHFNFDASSVESATVHDVVLIPPPPPLHDDIKWFFGSGKDTPADADAGPLIAFPRGSGHILAASPLLTPILRAPRYAYSYDPIEQADGIDPDGLFALGNQLKLVSALQALNSARVTIVGSTEMLANAWFGRKVRTPAGREALTWNRDFARQVSGWTFQELGVLRVNDIEHHLNEKPEESNPKSYRVRSDVTYSVSISEWEWDKWIPFAVPPNDTLQLEFTMLSPFWRLNMTTESVSSDRAVYTTTFMTPHQHGIFNFMLDYHREFLTYLEEKRTVTVRHMAHNEWRRSYEIVAAWPYIGALWTMIIGWLMFIFFWLYSEERPRPQTRAVGRPRNEARPRNVERPRNEERPRSAGGQKK